LQAVTTDSFDLLHQDLLCDSITLQDGAMARIRVLLADNHPPLLAAVRRLLAPDFDVVGEATDGAEAVRLASTLQPDVMVIDLAMPRMGGIEAIRQVSRARSSPAIVALTVLSDPAVLAAALEAGARGYVLKSQAGIELIPAIRAALAGEARVPAWPTVQDRHRSPEDLDPDNTD
jgi:DNA-binding NarL/FixJ family response regulator